MLYKICTSKACKQVSIHTYETIYDYLETFQWEGKTRVGMIPTNLHYSSNKVYPMKVTMFDHEPWSTLWKVYPIKGLQRLLGLTLLKDFNTLLEMYRVRGLKLIIKQALD